MAENESCRTGIFEEIADDDRQIEFLTMNNINSCGILSKQCDKSDLWVWY